MEREIQTKFDPGCRVRVVGFDSKAGERYLDREGVVTDRISENTVAVKFEGLCTRDFLESHLAPPHPSENQLASMERDGQEVDWATTSPTGFVIHHVKQKPGRHLTAMIWRAGKPKTPTPPPPFPSQTE